MIKPNFLIIGTQKGGTSWWRSMLRQHPDVFMPAQELHFFDNPAHYEQGLAWYSTHFSSVKQETAIGEKSPRYLLTDPDDPLELPRRIHAMLPDVKLLAVLRNPVERAISGINHHIHRGRLSPDIDLDTAIRRFIDEQAEHIRFGLYAQHLEAYYHFYDSSQVKVFIYEDDVVARPLPMLRATCEFLGIAPDFTFTNLDKKVNARRISDIGARLVHKLPLGSMTTMRIISTLERQMGRASTKKRPSAAVINELYDFYAEPNARLFALLDREITSWDKANAYITD